MFFQEAAGTPKEQQFGDFKTVVDYMKKTGEELLTVQSVIGEIANAFTRLGLEAENLNTQFTGTRERLQEISRTINDTTPDIVRMGGEFKDVRKTIVEIAEASRRQVVASSKDIRELYATGQVIDQSVSNIVESFGKVGYSYDKIADNLYKSITYVQSIGMNAKTVMKSVLDNTEQLSRFNFTNGIEGLTKMAAQASRLRFDMKQTFDLAERVLDPEQAIEVASAFQRLGVSVGNLADPFQLMNQSINDPSGLQTSLINMSKQFAYFDEQTKSFKINPQGILTLKEIANQTGLSATELRKTALAAAEMDDKLKRINTTGFKLGVSEEDKMIVANIARMGEGGEYEVSIKDEKGYEYQKKLSELQEEDFKSLIEQQKKAPKTIEEIQRAQLNTAELTLAEIKGFPETIRSAFMGLPGMQRNTERGLNLTRDVSSALNLAAQDTQLQKEIQGYKTQAETIMRTVKSESEQKKQLDELYKTAQENLVKGTTRILDRAGVEISQISQQQSGMIKKFIDYATIPIKAVTGKVDEREIAAADRTAGRIAERNVDYSILSNRSANPALGNIPLTAAVGATTTQRMQIDMPTELDINLNLNVNGPRIVDEYSLSKTIKDSSTQLRETMVDAIREKLIEKLRIPTPSKPTGV